MFSYIFMKILESRPHRYDWGIDFLTKGQAGQIKEHIVTNFVRSGMAILDVGCGTGDLAVRAARAGAFVTGVDISEGMLAVAQERVVESADAGYRRHSRFCRVLHTCGREPLALYRLDDFHLAGYLVHRVGSQRYRR